MSEAEEKEVYVEGVKIHYDEEGNRNQSFNFDVEREITPDEALSLGTKKIREFNKFLLKNFGYEITSKIITDRGYIRIGEIPNGLHLSFPTREENQVRTLHDLKKEDMNNDGSLGEIIVYAIDGTPSKGIIFCMPHDIVKRNEPISSDSFAFSGEYDFVFFNTAWDVLAEMTVSMVSPGFLCDLNVETQRKRYGDFLVTPENMFNVAMVTNDDEDLEKEFTIEGKTRNDFSIKTYSYDAEFHGKRFDMSVSLPFAFGYMGALREKGYEPQKIFAERVSNIIKDDIKYRVRGTIDYFSLEYAPYEDKYLYDVFDVATDIANTTQKKIIEIEENGDTKIY